MQKLILSFLVGLFAPALPKPAVTNALAPAAITAAQLPGETAQDIQKPAVSAEDASRARAAVKYEKLPGEGGGRLHRFTFADGTVVEFTDRAKRTRDQAQREWVVGYTGTQRASAEPDTTFTAAGQVSGLSPESIDALRFISRHEGGFDAINTWDRARFSWGFIQFAGGYGFPPALAHFKAKSPELFQSLLADYGIDVLPGANGRPEPVYVDPSSGKALRGAAAEQSFGDDPLAIALFIRAGRSPEVKQRQVEAAIRDYALPALTGTSRDVRLSEVLRSPQGLAMLIDRKVHEGNIARLGWALTHAAIIRNVTSPADWPKVEGLALDLAIRDADARTQIAELGDSSVTLLQRAAAGARNGDANLVPDGPSLTGARAALEQALYQADYRMVVSNRRDAIRATLSTALAGCTPDRMRILTPAEVAGELDRAAGTVRDAVSGFRFEYAIRDRLKDIRTSPLAGPAREALDYP
jgi:hypothetical protein